MSFTNAAINLGTEDHKRARKTLAWAIIAPLGMLLLHQVVGDTVLLRQTPDWVHWLSIVIGFIYGIYVGLGMWKLRHSVNQSTVKAAFVSVVIVPLAALTSTYFGRWAFDAAAFFGHRPEWKQYELRITGVRSGKSGTFAQLMSGPLDREVDAKISSALYSQLAAIRPPLWSLHYSSESYCISLETQLGRWGSLRARVPALWEAGLSEYHTCRAIPR